MSREAAGRRASPAVFRAQAANNRRLPLVFLLCLFCLVLQHMLLNRFPLLGGRALPAAAVVLIAAVLWGPFTGAGLGFFCGLFMDALLPGEAYYTIFLCLGSAAAGLVTRLYLERRLGICLLWALVLLPVMEFLYFALFFWLTGRAGLAAFWQVGLRNAALSLLCVPLLYPFLALLAKRPAEE